MNQNDSDLQIHRIGTLPISLSVRVCQRSMTLNEFVRWAPGTVLAFDQSPASPLTLCIGEKKVGDGHAVQLGSKIGLCVTRIAKPNPPATDS